MKRLRILITAGPTVEPIDPVRFISNHSTGLMGNELASAAKQRRHDVTLITGPTPLAPPDGVKVLKIETALELMKKVHALLKKADALIMASAVCDFRARHVSGKKLKSTKNLSLELVKNADILKTIPSGLRRGRVIAGFALESGNPVKNAKIKLKEKKLDLIVANAISSHNNPFGPGRTTVYIIKRDGSVKKLKKATKKQATCAILDRVEELCYTRR